jgi:hypothetical protein
MMKIALATFFIATFMLAGCATPELAAGDLNYKCSPAGSVDNFTVACDKQIIVVPSTSFVIACTAGDLTCASGRFPVKWDYALVSGGERCALWLGSEVTTKAYMDSYDGVPLAWVVTALDANGVPCAGWVPVSWLNVNAR